MKRKYNTLNEEMNRMKSLFGESRLYGNLVDNEKTNLITEAGPGKRYFAKNLSKAFNVTLKSLEDLGDFTKFLNREINSVDDMIKHFDEFPDIWKAVTKNKISMEMVSSNLVKLKKVEESNLLKGLSREKALDLINGFPSEGGMQDMVKDMWLEANDMASELPSVIDNRIAVIDPKSGEMIIGIQNSETGVIIGKNKGGEMVTVEKPQEWVKADNVKKVNGEGAKGEYVHFEVIPPGTTMKALDGKTVAFTEENVEAVIDAIEKLGEKESKQGNTVVNNYTTYNVSDGGNVTVGDNSGNVSGGKSGGEMAEELVDNTEPPKDIPEADVPNWRKRLIKATKSRLWKIGKGTRYWWNFHTIGEEFPKTNVGFANKRFGQVILRTFVLLPLTYEVGKTIDSEEREFAGSLRNNFGVNSLKDLWDTAVYVWSFKDDALELTEIVLSDMIKRLSGNQIDPDLVKIDVKKRVRDEILYVGTDIINPDTGERRSTLTCDKLLSMSSDGAVIKYLFEDHADLIILRDMKKLDLEGISADDYDTLMGKLKEFMVTVGGNTESEKEFVDLVRLARADCKSKEVSTEEMNEFMKDDYEVKFIIDPVTGDTLNQKQR